MKTRKEGDKIKFFDHRGKMRRGKIIEINETLNWFKVMPTDDKSDSRYYFFTLKKPENVNAGEITKGDEE